MCFGADKKITVSEFPADGGNPDESKFLEAILIALKFTPLTSHFLI
jgi:hypothetical protein